MNETETLYLREPKYQWLRYNNRYFRWETSKGWQLVDQASAPPIEMFHVPHQLGLQACLEGLRAQGLLAA